MEEIIPNSTGIYLLKANNKTLERSMKYVQR